MHSHGMRRKFEPRWGTNFWLVFGIDANPEIRQGRDMVTTGHPWTGWETVYFCLRISGPEASSRLETGYVRILVSYLFYWIDSRFNLIKFGVTRKLVRLIKTCLDGTRSKVRRRNSSLSSSFPIENGLKQGDALSPLLFSFTLEYAIRKVQDTNLGLDMNGTHQVLAYANDVNLIGEQ